MTAVVETMHGVMSVSNGHGGPAGGLYGTQNDLLLHNLLKFYEEGDHMEQMLSIINGESQISLRIIDWFATNYAKKYYTVYTIASSERRFKVYVDYKLKLKAYSKKRFDPFCRWDRISVPYRNGQFVQTTLGQLNFFKWALENDVINYIRDNYCTIENDMNIRNNMSRKTGNSTSSSCDSEESAGSMDSTASTSSLSSCDNKTRKKREELSASATKSIKKEKVDTVLTFK
jgi:hypothetical protein